MSFLGYGATGSSNNNTPRAGGQSSSLGVTSSDGRPSRDDYLQLASSSQDTENVISADGGLVPSAAGVQSRYDEGNAGNVGVGAGTDEKMPLSSQTHAGGRVGDDGVTGHDHGPGEHCLLPNMIQPLVPSTHHDMLEHVVVKVRDSADVTQKTIFYFWDEWKQFVDRGNVIDLGIGVVIGGAFSDIIDSFVADILTPPLSLWAAGTNLENSFIVLKHGQTPGKIYATYQEAQADGAVTENTGHFLKSCLNFVMIAFFLFWIVKAVHNIRKEKIRPPPKEKTCNWCRESIALDAFRCKFCQSFVKDIPGIEDAGVGMFVTIKKPRQQTLPQNQSSVVDSSAVSAPGVAKNGRSVISGSKDIKKMESI
ncbi:large-conductance mechanosensitive channel [Gamsiella multidivaricata]|uniref:large-conductance mechanosensitive channel n=1 Tax=Gamsiella multidivaricata TaxID=101098 RepID=UPI00221E5270|nr:large-conductance mechanosensitive channel [Gamsiella multidivaricata]KAI7831211.1 large-conductance mechanosensitive channel [Gamsiella multidivaricata]